jgi:hypothetical protein
MSAHLNPPRQQWDPRAVDFLQKNRAFRERHGAAADQAILLAHQYATRPRNPSTSNPALNGMGLTPNTPQYFQAVRDLLTMYAKDYGLRYDPQEEALDATQAAKISGVSANVYNNALRPRRGAVERGIPGPDLGTWRSPSGEVHRSRKHSKAATKQRR